MDGSRTKKNGRAGDFSFLYFCDQIKFWELATLANFIFGASKSLDRIAK